ncbi:MAG: 50S ribosomal protein L22 [bacterium]
MDVKAVAKYMRVSPAKMRRIAAMIVNRPYQDAVAILAYAPSPKARTLLKVLESAAANAEENHNLSKNSLYVSKALVDTGPKLKRWRAGSMGRAMRIRKPLSHITVVLTDRPPGGKKGG